MNRPDALAALPRIDALISAASQLVEEYGRQPVADAVRSVVADARMRVAGGARVPSEATLIAQASDLLAAQQPGPPRRVINATGVIIHTNLGRAPLSAAAVSAMVGAAEYCDLEYDLHSGQRGSRSARLSPLLATLTGAAAAIAVNNAAAALVLALSALAGGRGVVVSRGELVEIGGSFRLPEILQGAGVHLVEIGTTNRTTAADYEGGNDVALLLKVHPSNYRIEGFTQQASLAEVAAVAQRRGVPLVHDVGSGLLHPRSEAWLRDEPSVSASLRDGADLVVCSGDKLLGGPQAGLIFGRSDLVATCARHPLARALRLDKIRIAALVTTLEAHARGRLDDLPVWRSLTHDGAALRERTTTMAQRTGATIEEGATLVGGGAAPGAHIPGPVLRLATTAADDVAASLRRGTPPVIVRIEDAAVWVDLRTVAPVDDDVVTAQLIAAMAAAHGQ